MFLKPKNHLMGWFFWFFGPNSNLGPFLNIDFDENICLVDECPVFMWLISVFKIKKQQSVTKKQLK